MLLLLLLVAGGFSQSTRLNADMRFKTKCGEDRLTIVGSGDWLMHGPLQAQSYAAGSFTPLWADVLPLLQQADIMYGNLETPVARGLNSAGRVVSDPGPRFDKVVYSGYPAFNTNELLLRGIAQSRWDVVSTANNHALDRRSAGVDATIEALRSNNLKFTGTRHSSEGPAGSFATIVEKKGWRVAFIACTFSTNGMPDTRRQVLFCYENRDQVMAAIRDLAARTDVDAVIATPHWGVEYADAPSPKDIALGRQMVDAGATSVIGTHPHVVQPWERYVTADGREALIAYSTGNFVSGQGEPKKRLAAAVFLGLTRAARGQKAVVHGVSYSPMIMLKTPRYKLVPLPRGEKYGFEWSHFAKLFGNDRLLLASDRLDTCASQGNFPNPLPPRVALPGDQPAMNAAEECIRDTATLTRAQTRLIGLRHLSGRADGVWGRGSQAALDKYAAARRRDIRKCLTREFVALLDAENV